MGVASNLSNGSSNDGGVGFRSAQQPMLLRIKVFMKMVAVTGDPATLHFDTWVN